MVTCNRYGKYNIFSKVGNIYLIKSRQEIAGMAPALH
jgi:hypothetical protein